MNKEKGSIISHFKGKTVSKKDKPTEKKVLFKPNIGNNKASTSKKLWADILNDKSSKKILQKSWNSKTPQKEYAQKVRDLLNKHSKK